ncbi:glycosyl hydrolase [archaeon]|nr:MAG: glycosyl hydrolase [archaeon]
MQDGPQGFRTTQETGGDGSSTSFPSSMTVGATWDSELVYKWTSAMAQEFKMKGANMALGPGLGIARVPTAGRNFEYLCGEDPYFCSVLADKAIRGYQDNGIIGNAKHFVNNEIETHRMEVSSNVNERVRFEIYYPPFEAAAKAGVASLMCSYNRINDVYACENDDTLAHLRKDLGFNGFVVSDWTATKSTVKSLNAGMDMEMPYGLFYEPRVLEKFIASGQINEEQVNQAVTRVLSAMDKVGVLNSAPVGNPMANATNTEHNSLAREIASKATVLLQNKDTILPLDKDNLGECVAVFGDETNVVGCGSGQVNPAYIVTPQAGIRSYLAGTRTQVYYNDGKDLSSAADLAKKCGTAIVVVATSSCEGSDRDNLSLGEAQDSLVSTIAAANPHTIVDVVTPGAVLMPWSGDVSGLLISWMPGQEAGNALADVLFGSVNPSGRLSVTMPNKDNEIGFTPEQYPGVGMPMPEAAYSEELLIGYRWYDANRVEPKFCFGFGLSYTTFSYIQAKVRTVASDSLKAVVSVMIKNTGERDGDEVVQLYLQYPATAGEPPKQLRGFSKVFLKKGQATFVELPITQRDVSVWDTNTHSWQVVQGTFTAYIGASNRDIHLSQTFQVA